MNLLSFLGIILFLPQYSLGQDCFAPLAKIVRPHFNNVILDSIKSQYHHFDHIVRSQNIDFINFVNKADRQKTVLFYHFENSVLKDLNDKVFLDKNVSQALTIKYQKILLEIIEDDYFLKKNILHRYADYKSLRFVFKSKNNSNHFNKRLKIAETEALKKFQEFVEFNDLGIYINKRLTRSKVKNVEDWFLSGFSNDPTMSALKARYFRNHPRVNQTIEQETKMISDYFWDLRNEMLDVEDDILKFYRGKASRLVNPALMEANDGREQISFEILRLFRKLNDTDADFERAQLEVYSYLGILIDRKIYRKHLELIAKFNEFSPPVYQEFTRAVEFSRAGKGVISVDVANLGMEGLYSLYGGLVRTPGRNEIIERITGSYWPVHNKLHEVYRPTAHNVIKSSGLQYVHPIESGDDMLFFFKKAIKEESLEEIVTATNGTNIPSKLRIVELPSKYLESSRRIPELRMSRYISRAESLEKEIRTQLRSSLSIEVTRKTSIGVRVKPFSGKQAEFQIYIKIKDKNYNVQFLKRELQKIKSFNSSVEFIII
jgi:hypothetical protein